jgi:hypothetical protein|tara:strand:+ start:4994 stop:5140 length:147 start_codon:yes stop_codon:yes gene_type:complete
MKEVIERNQPVGRKAIPAGKADAILFEGEKSLCIELGVGILTLDKSYF